MMSYPELYILRHGETVWNAENRMQGWLNSPLTAQGEMHAARQYEILRSRDLAGFTAVSSPLGRCFQTAGIAVAPLFAEVRTDPRLREIYVGDWQGQVRTELDWDGDAMGGPDGPLAMYAAAPGGEGFEALAARARDFLDSLEGPHVLVTHGITSRMLRLLILGRPWDDLQAMADLPGGQGVVYHMKDGNQVKLD